jgi:hypothetical protein
MSLRLFLCLNIFAVFDLELTRCIMSFAGVNTDLASQFQEQSEPDITKPLNKVLDAMDAADTKG